MVRPLAMGTIRRSVELSLNDKTPAGLRRTEANFKGFASRIESIGKSFENVGSKLFSGGIATAGIGAALLGPLNAATVAAGDFNEIVNAFNATFRESAKESRKFFDGFSRSTNRSSKDIINAATAFQSFFVGGGFANKEAEKLTRTVVTLSTELSSFRQVDVGEANSRFLSFLAGSNEALERYGISAREARLDAEFLSLGLSTTTRTASEQQKQLARLSIAAKALSSQGALGDAARTADSFANSSVGVTAALGGLKVAIGQTTLETRARWNKELIQTLRFSKDWVDANQNLVASYSKVALGLVAGGVAVAGVGATFLTIGGALQFVGRTAATTLIPVAGLGKSVGLLGGAFSKLTGLIASPFVLLGSLLGSVFGSSVLLARGIGAIVTALAAVVGAIGVLPLLVAALAAAGVAYLSAEKSSARLRQELEDLLTIGRSLVGGLLVVGRAFADYVIKPLDASTTAARSFLAELIRVIAYNKSVEDATLDFATATSRAIDEITGLDVAAAIDPNKKRAALPSFELPEFGDIGKGAAEAIEKAFAEISPALRGLGDKLNAAGKDAFGIDLKAEAAKLEEQFAKLSELGKGVNFDKLADEVSAQVAAIREKISKASQGNGGEAFEGLGGVEDVLASIQAAVAGGVGKSGVGKGRSLLESAGTFASSAQRTIGGDNAARGEKKLDDLRKKAEERNQIAKEQRDELRQFRREQFDKRLAFR